MKRRHYSLLWPLLTFAIFGLSACQKNDDAPAPRMETNLLKLCLGTYSYSMLQFDSPDINKHPVIADYAIPGLEVVSANSDQLEFRIDGEVFTVTTETVEIEEGFAFHIANGQLELSDGTILEQSGSDAFEFEGTAYDGYYNKKTGGFQISYGLSKGYGWYLISAYRP